MLGAAAVLAAVFVALGVAVTARWAPLWGLDLSVEPAVHRVVVGDPVLLALARVVTTLGSPVAMNLVVTLAAVALLVTHRPRPAIYLVAARLLELGVETATKALVDRPRPVWDDPVAFGTNTSFPSGHSAGTAVVVVALLLLGPLAVGRPTGGPARAAVGVGVALGVVLLLVVPVSRVLLGVHYPGDVTAGLALGAACALALAPLLLLDRPAEPDAQRSAGSSGARDSPGDPLSALDDLSDPTPSGGAHP